MLSTTSRLTARLTPGAIRLLSTSPFADIPQGPPDAIIGLNEAYKLDPNPAKVNVGVGAYRTDDGLPYTLPCVAAAQQILAKQSLDNEYLPISGDQKFVDHALRFAYGDECPAMKKGRVEGVQTLSGTGGLRVFGE